MPIFAMHGQALHFVNAHKQTYAVCDIVKRGELYQNIIKSQFTAGTLNVFALISYSS